MKAIIKKDLIRNSLILFLSLFIFTLYCSLYLNNMIIEAKYENKIIDFIYFNKIFCHSGISVLYIVLFLAISSLIFSSEIESKNFEFLLSLSIKRDEIFFGKLIALSVMILISIIYLFIFYLIHLKHVLNIINIYSGLKYSLITFITVIFFSIISLYLSLYIKRKVLSMVVSILILYFFATLSSIIENSRNINYIIININDKYNIVSLLISKYLIDFLAKNDIRLLLYFLPYIILSILLIFLSYFKFKSIDFEI